jgi:hypothetical protein
MNIRHLVQTLSGTQVTGLILLNLILKTLSGAVSFELMHLKTFLLEYPVI